MKQMVQNPMVQNQKATHRTRTFPVRLDACYNMNTAPLSSSASGCSGDIKPHKSEWYQLELCFAAAAQACAKAGALAAVLSFILNVSHLLF